VLPVLSSKGTVFSMTLVWVSEGTAEPVHALSVDRLWPIRAGRGQATIATTSMAERRTPLISEELYGVCPPWVIVLAK
jgi:hypothetical protein